MPAGMKSAILYIVLVINLPGCAGYYYSKSSEPFERDLPTALLALPKEERESLDVKEAIYNDERALLAAQKEAERVSRGKEIKFYNDSNKWCGLTIWAVVFPIPLWLPVCRTYTEITFEKGRPISAREQKVQGSGYLCGPLVPTLGISSEPLPARFCESIQLEPAEMRGGGGRYMLPR